MKRPLIVGFGGTTRAGSSVEKLIGAVLTECKARGADIRQFGGAALAALPHFHPEAQERSDEERSFVDAVRGAQGLVIGSPGYHGGVSGLVKNAIDLLEDTRADERCYFDNMPVGLIVSAAGWQAGGLTLTALRGIIHAMRGWPTPSGITANSVAQRIFDEAGAVADGDIAKAISVQAKQIMRLATLEDSTAN
jgi:FMN reductase